MCNNVFATTSDLFGFSVGAVLGLTGGNCALDFSRPSIRIATTSFIISSRYGYSFRCIIVFATGADQPECTTCRCPLNVKHILLDCFYFNDTRNKHFVASSMEELFRTANVHNILDFTNLILQKKLIFTASYDVYKHFYSSYLALILR